MCACVEQGKTKRKKVAIIGTGLAGLHAAYLLSETETLRQSYDVHLFEKGDKLGLDGNSITVEESRIDVPLRSFNEGYYPNLMKLYRRLGVSIRQNNFTFSFTSSNLRDLSPFLIYNGHSGLKGISLPTRFRKSIKSNLIYIHLIILIFISYVALLLFSLYHFILGHLHDPASNLSRESLQDWLARYPRLFAKIFNEEVLYPLFSGMTTSSIEQVQETPTAEILLYVATTFLRSHYTVSKGVQQVQQLLIRKIPAENFHMTTSVHKVQIGDYKKDSNSGNTTICTHVHEQPPSKFRISTYNTYCQSSRKEYNEFDRIIFCTPASRSALILKESINTLLDTYQIGLSRRLQNIQMELEQVKYEESTVINHTDDSLMPPSKSDWRDLNLVTSANRHFNESKIKSVKHKFTMATHICNQLKDGRHVFQTTNALIGPNPELILNKSTFPRALTTSKSRIKGLFCWEKKSASRFLKIPKWNLKLGELQSKGASEGLYFCGSYSQGIPLLEGCISSSTLVVEEILHQDGIL